MRRLLAASLCLAVAAPAWAADKDEPIFEPGAKLKVEVANGSGGEGPAWHPKLGLLTTGDNGDVMRLDRDGKSTVYRKDAETNGLLFDKDGRLLACESTQRRVTRTELDGKITVLADAYNGKRLNEPNDVTIDSKGRVYFSDPRYSATAGKDQLDEKGRTIEGVYRVDPDGKITRPRPRGRSRPTGVLVSAGRQSTSTSPTTDNNHDGGARKLWRL